MFVLVIWQISNTHKNSELMTQKADVFNPGLINQVSLILLVFKIYQNKKKKNSSQTQMKG